MIETVDALVDFLEPSIPGDDTRAQSGIRLDRSASAPFLWEPGTLYAWEESLAQVPIGTGDVLERFEVILVLTRDGEGEEADSKRRRAVSEALSLRVGAYLTALRLNSSTANWTHVEGVADADFVRQLGVRGIALRVTGNRVVT